MDSIIYGLEFQSRSLVAQQDSEEICFFTGTQIINGKNFIHQLELDETSNKLHATVFAHDHGEVWKLTSSPHDKLIASVYNTNKRSPQSNLVMGSAILRIPDNGELDPSKEFHEFIDTEILSTETFGSEIKTTEFNPTNSNLLATVIDNKVLLFNRAEAKSQVIAEVTGKNSQKFSGGLWSVGNQFVAIYENGLKCYDIRDVNHNAWQIDDAHSQPVRCIDVNPNKAFHVATAGDDSSLKIWDVRNNKEPVFVRRDHKHWIFSVTFNKFHDQLLLTSSSDLKVNLTCVNSCSSEAPNLQLQQSPSTKDSSPRSSNDEEDYHHEKKRNYLQDGLLETFEQHEDSVYCVEWSAADPWIFASLSYDGRLIVQRVPKKYKYQILL